MAYDQEPHEKIASILDTIEMLPRLMAAKEDKTEEFRLYLKSLGDKHSEFKGTLAVFDTEGLNEVW